jgi:hypothetical protein
MIPTATGSIPRSLDRTAYDRMFYSGFAIVMAVLVFAGFARTFYLRPLFGVPQTVTGATVLTPLAQLHGVIFTLWVALFVVQTWLIASRRIALHRRMGVAGVVLAAVMSVVGLLTAFAAARRGSAPPGLDALTFLVVPVFDIVLFVGFVSAAVLRRKEKEAHKRLMLLAYGAIIPAAVARLPGVLALGPPGFTLSFLPLVGAAVYDYWSRGRVSSIYWWGLPILVLSVPGRLAIAATPMWQAFASFVTR